MMVRSFIFILLLLLLPVTFYTQNWMPLGSGMNGQVTALTVYNGELIAGGNFYLMPIQFQIINSIFEEMDMGRVSHVK